MGIKPQATARVDELPRTVFRVLYSRDGKPFVAQRELIGKSGSWVTLRCGDGSIVKVNGHESWSETILHAIQREAEFVMHRYSMLGVFKRGQQAESMDELIVVAMEWGVLLGELEHGRRTNSATTNRADTESTRIDGDGQSEISGGSNS